MKNTFGIISLLLISQSIFAEDKLATQPDTQLIESDVVEAAAPASTHVMQEQSGFSRGSVVRSAFTTEIAEREPTQNLQKLTNDNGQVMFFTELRDMSGQTALHRWEYDGKVVAEIEFNVKGPRWRVWSSKSLVPEWTGDWKVSVVNGAGDVISEKNLSYEVATTSTPETMPAAETTMPAETTTSTVPADSAQ